MPSGGAQSIDGEFAPDAVTSNWRATLDQKPPDFGSPIDMSESNIIRLFEAQEERRRKAEQASQVRVVTKEK
jgi:hypothetical protein